MNRTEKIVKLQNLKEAIRQKNNQIKQEKIELEKLESEYNAENESELPILLFWVDQTLPMPDSHTDWSYEFIYYCPDLDDIKCIIKHKKNEFLPHTVDLREKFEKLGMPKKSWPADAYFDHRNIVMQAVSTLKVQIEELFQSSDINSWAKLGELLVSGTVKKGQTKVLKATTIQK